MFAHPSDQPTVLPSVLVHDRALVLSLSQADNQTVWRFDLDSLIEHGFRVTGRDGFYDLSVTDLNGSEQLLARFLDKNEAHRILAALHQALSTPDTGKNGCCCAAGTCATDGAAKTCGGLRGTCRTLFGWLTFWRLLTLVAIGLLLYALLRPFPVSGPLAVDTHAEPPASGVPLDADQLLQ